jgi:hypothetical protein
MYAAKQQGRDRVVALPVPRAAEPPSDDLSGRTDSPDALEHRLASDVG